MNLTLKDKLGDGAYADVWRAHDNELNRDVAIKIIRPAGMAVADALAHARALARAAHPNVVQVHALEKIKDPETEADVDCVVMELLEGETLDKTLKAKRLTANQVLSIGAAIIDGLAHIHAQGMVHGDLHAENIMIVGDTAKVIDILYWKTLASVTTGSRESLINRDIVDLRTILVRLINESELGKSKANAFAVYVKSGSGFDELKSALQDIINKSSGFKSNINSPVPVEWRSVLLPLAFVLLVGMGFGFVVVLNKNPEISIPVPGSDNVDRAISMAKMEGVKFKTPRADQIVAKFYVRPLVLSKVDDVLGVVAMVSVSPFKPLQSESTFDAGDCRFLGRVTRFDQWSKRALLAITSISCTDNSGSSFSLESKESDGAPIGIVSNIDEPTEPDYLLQNENGEYSVPMFANGLIRFSSSIVSIPNVGKTLQRF